MDAKEIMQILFGLFGGLAIFIFGMNMMSECLQKAAGEKMKTILALLTRNPVLGALAGALTTAVLQSSSATTVMAIGFVSANLMTLPQAISIIIGANIGTTMTAQLLAFKISDYILAFVFIGFMMSFVGRSERVKNIGQTIFAFGLLFLGIETMGDVMKPLASSPVFTNLIGSVANIPILGVAVGTMMTLVVQSSSATIAVLQNFASQAGADGNSILGLAGAIPILLGDNIGTTITALLACIGQSRDAKRTALAHCTFNISGCLLFIWFVKPFAYVIQMISPQGAEVEVIARQIANAHTAFNCIMTLIWIPLLPILVKIVCRIIPDGKAVERAAGEPMYLDRRLLSQPTAALQMVARESVRSSELVLKILNDAQLLIRKPEPEPLMDIREKTNSAHHLNQCITEYLTDMFSSGVLTEEQASQSTELLYVMGDVERITALCQDYADCMQERVEQNYKYSNSAMKDMEGSLALVQTMFDGALNSMQHADASYAERAREMRGQILDLHLKMRKAHMGRVKKGKCDAGMTAPFDRLLHCIDRIGNSCINIADAAAGALDLRYFITEDKSSDNQKQIPTATAQA